MDFICPVCGSTEYYEYHEKGRKVRFRCKPCQQARMKAIYATEDYKKKHRIADRLRRRNCSEELYNAFMKQQDGKCAICGKPLGEKLSADHDHKTGKPRGLLCCSCNTGLGLFHDDVGRLKNAIAYLEKEVK